MKKNKSNFRRSDIAHTYSIVARDPKTGEMGVGVQSHYFSVGSIVSWGESGVGVVATQSLVNASFGLHGLELLKQGKSPKEALDFLISEDEGRDVRQVAILDAQGRVAAHTGSKCIIHAGHIEGENFSVQANMMLTDKVWSAMAKSFKSSVNLPLAERIVKTMEAAETVGGDIRGKQSAAILIVGSKEVKNKWEDKIIDLRVEDNEQPVKELSRLLKLHRAYKHMDKGDLAIEQNEMEKALKEYDSALNLFPENLEMKFWTAVSLANNQKLKEASELFKAIFKKDNNWRLLTERLPKSGLLNLTKKELEDILSL
ncbi:MAG: Zn-dependent protease [Promethearchaeota archaeon Loki_b31]|nr:MAG: Zn-dependent protease [Candidatus Lokiarchaeota archaeon Loki_b31]